MTQGLEYKNYIGLVNFDGEDEIFHGKIEFIRDLVTFEGTNSKELKHAFMEAVEDYLETCKELGKDPDKPFKGSFNVRTSEALHRDLALTAKKKGTTLNKIVVEALENYFFQRKTSQRKQNLTRKAGGNISSSRFGPYRKKKNPKSAA